MLEANETLLTSRELARHLRLSIGTIRIMTRNNQIPFIRVGKSVRYSLTTVMTALSKNPENCHSESVGA